LEKEEFSEKSRLKSKRLKSTAHRMLCITFCELFAATSPATEAKNSFREK